jgi:hypothetical protein
MTHNVPLNPRAARRSQREQQGSMPTGTNEAALGASG